MKIKFARLLTLILLLLVSAAFRSVAQPSDLIISEYVEGSSNNKALEFYNGTGTPINLATGNYVIQMYFNGSTSATTVISLTGTIAPNGVFVLAQASATFASSSFVNQTSSASWYNGDDAVVLRKGGVSGTIVDVIGQIGFDPGAEWGTGLTSTADNTIRRKAGDCTGDTNPSDVFDPGIKYDGFATDVFTGLGSHASTCTTGSPITLSISSLNFTTTPGVPSPEQSYTVKGNSLTADININIPSLSNFGLSTVSGGPYTVGITIPAATANAAPVAVYVIFSPASAGSQTGNISHTSGSSTTGLAVQGTAVSPGITPVYMIQGSGPASLLAGNTVTTRGIVTGDFQGANQLGGFFIQDTTGDGNALTSDGIFVFNTTFNVSVGDYVSLIGDVEEFFNKTELKNITSLSVLSSGNTLMTPVSINLPVNAVTDLERYEGMLVKFPQMLTATETFTLGRFGEIALSAGGRLFNPTNFIDPNDNPASGTTSTGTSNVAAVTGQQSLNNRSRILLDDGSNVEDPAIVPYLNPADTTFRLGTTVTDLTGAMDFDFSEYRLHATISPAFVYAARPSVPAVGAGNVKVAGFNVLNYFNGNGSGGGFPTARGANTLAEFNRQRAKIIAAIRGLDADVIGLTEIENDGSGSSSAIADLVNGLNSAAGSGTYAYIPDPTGGNGNTGTDEIKVAFIYKPSKVTPSGLAKADVNPVHNRPPLAQTFTLTSNNEKFTAIINHFKSKSSSGASGANADQGDGQGAFNANRKLQANALLTFITAIQAATGDSDVITMGDYNAYEQEDPMDILAAGGLTNVLPGAYSYVFEGQSGSLDHALVSGTLISKVTGAGKWHINSDEPIVKDYNQEFHPAYVYRPDAFRSSDHDPVLVGLNLQLPGNIPPVVTITNPVAGGSYTAGSTITMNVHATDGDGQVRKVEFYNNGIKFGEDTTAPYQVSGADVEANDYALTAKAFDNDGDSSVSDTVRITVAGCAGTGSLLAEGYTDIFGANVINLASNPKYPNNPDVVTTVNKMEYGNFADYYGGRLRGYICAPVTGNYLFYIASDETSELWLSTDENPANKRRIAFLTSPVASRGWFTYFTQQSPLIYLVKGVRYYIETLHKEATGADHLSVAWKIPGAGLEGPIPGSRLIPWSDSTVVTQATGRSIDFGQAMREAAESIKGLTVKASPNPSPGYFTLVTRSNSDKLLTVIVTDIAGRVVERRSGIAANGSVQIGRNLLAGIYNVEVTQGSERIRLKLARN